MKKTFFYLVITFMFIALATHASAAEQPRVLINEIAWMGSTVSETNEWIELFNSTDKDIDLSGWSLTSADGLPAQTGKLNIHLQRTIQAKGYYLLKRKTKNSVLSVEADLVYTGALNNNGMDLKLYDSSGNFIDEADYPAEWPAGDNISKQTMERTGLAAWQTSKNPNGTPRAQNSIGAIKKIPSNLIKQPAASAIPKKIAVRKTDNAVAAISDSTDRPLEAPETKQTDPMNPWLLLFASLGIIVVASAVILVAAFKRKQSLKD